MWYHDHTLGMTRVERLRRAGRASTSCAAVRATQVGGSPSGPSARRSATRRDASYYEIPIAIQDRSFNADGSLFYPDNRAFFEGLEPRRASCEIPFIPDQACDGRRATSRRSSTRSSSATRWSSTARPGPSSRSSSAATASAS